MNHDIVIRSAAGPSQTSRILNNTSPCQPILRKYKQSLFENGKEKRSFVANWFKETKWKD